MAGRIPDPRIRPIDAERGLCRFGRLDRRSSGADPADRADDGHRRLLVRAAAGSGGAHPPFGPVRQTALVSGCVDVRC